MQLEGLLCVGSTPEKKSAGSVAGGMRSKDFRVLVTTNKKTKKDRETKTRTKTKASSIFREGCQCGGSADKQTNNQNKPKTKKKHCLVSSRMRS